MKCCDFKPSNFRTIARIERRERVADGQGGWVDGWALVRSLPIMWKSVSIAERAFAMQIQAEASHKAYARFTLPLPQADQRLVYKGKAFNIIGVADLEMLGKVVELSLAEGVAI